MSVEFLRVSERISDSFISRDDFFPSFHENFKNLFRLKNIIMRFNF